MSIGWRSVHCDLEEALSADEQARTNRSAGISARVERRARF